MGERPDRRRWREEGGERVAGVGEGRRCAVTEDIRRVPQQRRYAEPIFVNARHKDLYRVLPPQPEKNGNRDAITVLFN